MTSVQAAGGGDQPHRVTTGKRVRQQTPDGLAVGRKMVRVSLEAGMIKWTADWLEKMSAGAILIGIFQNNTAATVVGLAFFGFCLFLSEQEIK